MTGQKKVVKKTFQSSHSSKFLLGPQRKEKILCGLTVCSKFTFSSSWLFYVSFFFVHEHYLFQPNRKKTCKKLNALTWTKLANCFFLSKSADEQKQTSFFPKCSHLTRLASTPVCVITTQFSSPLLRPQCQADTSVNRWNFTQMRDPWKHLLAWRYCGITADKIFGVKVDLSIEM